MKICIDAGHGGHEVGCCNIEKNLNLEYAMDLKHELEKLQDVTIIMTRLTDVYLSLTERANVSNINNCDLFISCHLNAFNASARGTEIIHSIYANKRFINLCESICTNISTILNIPNRGVKTRLSSSGRSDYYTVIANTKCPSMIIEPLFLSNVEDRKAYNPFSIVRAIVSSLITHYDLKYKDNIKDESKLLYRVVSGSFEDYKNAKLQQQHLKDLDIDSFIVEKTYD